MFPTPQSITWGFGRQLNWITSRIFWWNVTVLAVTCQDFGSSFAAKKDLKRMKALFGWNNGTSCPAPLTVAKVIPSYTSVHPATYDPRRKKCSWFEKPTVTSRREWKKGNDQMLLSLALYMIFLTTIHMIK